MSRLSQSSEPQPGINHILLTRFNLPSFGFESMVRSQPDWLARRVELFETYCLPSVRNQSNQNFSWIVYFDPHSPDWLLERIARWLAYPNFQPIFREQVDYAHKMNDIRRFAKPRRARLLTTNLDNDDALAVDFVERLQAASPPTGRVALYFRNGLILSRGSLFRHSEPHNAFCSVSESWAEPVTCWVAPHNQLPRYMPVQVLEGAPSWLQVVHGHNVANRIKGRRVSPEPFTALFGGRLMLVRGTTRTDLLVHALIVRPFRLSCEALRAGLKAIALSLWGEKGPDRAKSLWMTWSGRIRR